VHHLLVMHDEKLKVFFHLRNIRVKARTFPFMRTLVSGSDYFKSREKKFLEPAVKIQTVNAFRASAFCTLLPP
jgi:hypothetical protein